jgi:hypothetical protein
MNNNDIREEILLNIDSDIRSYTQSCSVDKRARQICTTKNYWDKIFIQHGLPLSKVIYDTPKGWIKAFEKERTLKGYINIILNAMHNPNISHFYGKNYDDDIDIILIDIQYFNIEQLYDLPNIDTQKLSELWNKYILFKLHINVDNPQIVLSYNLNKYDVRFEFYFNDMSFIYYYETSIDNIKIILYRVLSSGLIPYNVYSNRIKL